MLCAVNLVIGVTGEFRKETLKFHDASRAHQKAVAAHNACRTDSQRPCINGPSLENFSPIPAIELCYSIRSRRPEFK